MWFRAFQGLKNQVISAFHSRLAVFTFRSRAKNSLHDVGGPQSQATPLNDAAGRKQQEAQLSQTMES